MTMADVLSVTLIILGLLLTLPGLWLFERALMPATVERARRRLQAKPVATTLAGLLPAALFFVVSVVLLNQGGPALKFAGLLLFLGGFLVSGLGLAALATTVGERLPSPVDGDRPWRGQVRGSVCLELAFLLPLVGWFAVLPLSLCAGAGAACLALLFRDDVTPAAAVPGPAAEPGPVVAP